ncbi:MAG: hypothetical protein KKB13_04155 [Chloroflexi bacterium]|nr:hypothetical protein [Chloroflexota bacterium]
MPKSQTTFVVATIPDDPLTASVYRVACRPGTDVRQAVQAAAQEFLGTPVGQAYHQQVVGRDSFNWGDALVSVPPEVLRRHGVLEFVGLYDELEVLVVDHDECVARCDV